MNAISIFFLILAGCVVPLAYIRLCFRMYPQNVWWFTYIAYFILFGIVGGFCFAFAMSPSGLATASIVFLMIVATPACVISTLILQFRKSKTGFEKTAMIVGYAYSVPLCLLILAGIILSAFR